MASDYFSPTMICNQALARIGLHRLMLGDIEEGTEAAQVCLMAFGNCRDQLLRAAHWDWARREVPLQLVADASGQTANVGNLVPGGFLYSYNYPTDCLKVRFIPANYWSATPPVPSQNITPFDSSAPVMQGLGQPPYVGQRLVPSRFLIASDSNFIPEGASNNLPGISPIGQTVICSNVQNARGVYTFNATYPNLWDAQFREALIAYIASEICLPLHKDKKLGETLQRQRITEATAKIQNARVTNGNESWSSSDIAVDWMQARISGGYYGYGGRYGYDQGPGYWFGYWDQVSFSNGSAI